MYQTSCRQKKPSRWKSINTQTDRQTDRHTHTQTAYQWADENTSIDTLKKILIPYVEAKWKELGVRDKPSLLICNVFKGQWMDAVKDVVKESNGKMVPIPTSWTNYFQPLDLTVNKSSKDFLCQEAESWYSQEIVKQMEAGKRPDEIKVDICISVVKPLHTKWIVNYYDYARNNPDLIINGWKESGIINKLSQKINLDPFEL